MTAGVVAARDAGPAPVLGTPAASARLSPLAWASAVYLLVPVVIFAIGWLRPLPGVLVLIGVGGGIVAIARPGGFAPRWWLAVLLGAVAATGWVFASGIVDDATLPTFDWAKHTALLGDLVRSPWPARVRLDGEDHFVRYYVAWYLPPALVGKSLGLGDTLWLSGAWSALGFTLVVAQVVERFSEVWARVAAAIGFVLFSGLDVVGAWIATAWSGQSRYDDFAHLEVWTNGVYKLESITTQAIWVQQHALGAWLGTLLVLEGLRTRRPAVLVLAVFATLLWSPFVALGIVPFALIGVVRLLAADAAAWRAPAVVGPALAMAPGATVLGLYLSAEPAGIPMQAVWEPGQSPAFPFSYLLFVAVEFLILFALAAWLRGRVDWTQWTALVVLLVAPLLIYGAFNDFGRRVSAPALLIVCLMVLSAAFDSSTRQPRAFVRPARVVLWCCMLVAAVTPVVEIVSRFRFADMYRTPIECSLADDICSGIGPDLKVQYLVPVDALRLRGLLR